jgi:hypothetical protein
MKKQTIAQFLMVERLIASIAFDMSQTTGMSKDDLESFGREFFLMQLAHKYNPRKSALSTFVMRCMRNAMLDYARRQRRMIPLADMGEFDIERALPVTDFVWPDERLEVLAEKMGAQAWSAVEAILAAGVEEKQHIATRRGIVKQVLWDWMKKQVQGAL